MYFTQLLVNITMYLTLTLEILEKLCIGLRTHAGANRTEDADRVMTRLKIFLLKITKKWKTSCNRGSFFFLSVKGGAFGSWPRSEWTAECQWPIRKAADSGAGLTQFQEQKQCQIDCSYKDSVIRSLELVFLGVLRKMAENREKATDQMKIWKESRGSQVCFFFFNLKLGRVLC